MPTLHAMAAHVVIALFTSVPIRSRRRVNMIRVITGRGRAKLRTTWLITKVLVGFKPIAATITAGIIVTTRRTQIGIVKPTNPCIITCPAIVPTVELERPEGNSEIAKTRLAAPPKRGVGGWEAGVNLATLLCSL